MADNRSVVFDFIGRDRVSRVMRSIGDEAEKLDGQMTAAGAGAAALAGPVAAAGLAFAAFAAVAVPSVKDVISAQEDLAGSWSTLSTEQRASAMLVKGLSSEYKALADSYEPQALATFNNVVGTARNLLPELTKVVDGTAVGVQGLVGDIAAFADGPEVSRFLSFAADIAPQALDETSQALTTTGSMALSVVQDMAPLGLTMLQMANGTLTALNAAAQFNPMLTQLALTTLLLRGPITAAVGGIGNMATRMRAAAAPTAGLSRSTKLLNIAAAAGPTLYIAAGVALGIMAIKAATAKSEHEKLIDTMRIEARATGNNLAGHQAYTQQLQTQADVLAGKAIIAQTQMSQAARNSIEPARAQSREAGVYRQKLQETSRALEEQRAITQRVQTGVDLLAAKYGIGKVAAQQLATAAGVDLSTAIDKSGKLTGDAATKILNYRLAVDQASRPTQQMAMAMQGVNNQALTMDDRLKSLQASLDAYFNPTLAVFNATTQLHGAVAQLGKAFADAKGKMDGSTEASRQARTAFAETLQKVSDLRTAIFSKDQVDQKALGTLRSQLPVLYAYAGRNRDLRNQVDALARSTQSSVGAQNISRESFMRAAASMKIAKGEAERLWKEYAKLPKQTKNAADGIVAFQGRSMRALHAMSDKDLAVTVYANGKFRRATTAGLNAGGPVPWTRGAVPGKDTVPAMLTPNEHVWTDREVHKAGGHQAVERLRALALQGKLAGFKVGGAVSFRARTPSKARLGSVMSTAENAHVKVWRDQRAAYEVAQSQAEVWKKWAGSGGSVVAAMRSIIGYPYSWGGGGRGGPSYGIGRGAGTYGFDCSGATEYGWWKGARVGIGGTTFAQWPASRPSPRRPGALGFPHMNHVVMSTERGTIIEAPYTGAHVREVRSGRGYNWRWPRGASTTAGLNLGGKVQRLGEHAALYGGAATIRDARLAGAAGDPARRRAAGGRVAGSVPYLVGEDAPEVFVPRAAGTVHRPGSKVVQVTQNISVEVKVPPGANKAAIGKEITDCLKAYKHSGGRLAENGSRG